MCLLQSFIRLRCLLWRLTLLLITKLLFKAFLLHTGISMTWRFCLLEAGSVASILLLRGSGGGPGLWNIFACLVCDPTAPFLTIRQRCYQGIVAMDVAVRQLVSVLNRNCSKEIHRTCWRLQELLWNSFSFRNCRLLFPCISAACLCVFGCLLA